MRIVFCWIRSTTFIVEIWGFGDIFKLLVIIWYYTRFLISSAIFEIHSKSNYVINSLIWNLQCKVLDFTNFPFKIAICWQILTLTHKSDLVSVVFNTKFWFFKMYGINVWIDTILYNFLNWYTMFHMLGWLFITRFSKFCQFTDIEQSSEVL